MFTIKISNFGVIDAFNRLIAVGHSPRGALASIGEAVMSFTKAQFPHLWGDIPARPFFPDEARGLPDDLNNSISDVLYLTLENALKE